MTAPARQGPARLAWLMLASALTALGCAQLLDFKDDVPADAAGTSSGAAGETGASNGGADAGPLEAGGSPAKGDGGDTSSAGNGTSSAIFCDDTPVGETAPCSETAKGTAIAFPGGTPQGPCALGAKTCQKSGSFGPCVGAVAPGATDCSSKVDANCDGTPDQDQCGACGPGDTQYCYDGPDGTKGVGACMQGTQVCQLDVSGAGYVWGPCAGEVTPATNDSCDMGNDATCNDTPNEGCDCIDGDMSDCGSKLHLLGNCAAGTTKCVNGAWSTCSVGMKANDTCDAGDDATCNGSANEGCPCVNNQTQSCGTNATGCTLGTQTCQGGNWGSCLNNTCGDFMVPAPTEKCFASGVTGEDAENICTVPVCPAYYHVTDCGLYVSLGQGSCDFNGYNGADHTEAVVTATKAVNAKNVTCSFSDCSCRLDGF